MHNTGLILIGGWLLLLHPICTLSNPAPVMLANVYDAAKVDLADYWVSEKYDGMRAYWDGEQLLTRGGSRIHAPDWFTAGWPSEPLDGELWMGRGQFELVTATVRDVQPDTVAWQRVRFMVFDLPSHQGTFTLRLQALQRLLANVSIAWMQPVEQFKVTGQDDLDTRLREVISAGGEGLMLHRGDSMYRAARSDDLLKVKPVDDAEARVTGHLPGKGKYQGLLGALQVETPEGLRFRLGSGFTDEQRRSPPPIGSQVTYRYQGKTAEGVPRFAVFLRVRDEGIR